MTQQFHKGDLVHVAKNLGSSMSHFTADIDAIVIGSYKDQYGGSDTDSYTLHLKGRGRCSWYYGSQLELLEHDRINLLDQWEHARDAEIKQKSDLDWIFEHGPEVVESPHGASVEALGRVAGIHNLWGSNGEGINYVMNSFAILAAAESFLRAKDKAGYVAACSRLPIKGLKHGD